VQAASCAPLWKAFRNGTAGPDTATIAATCAEGVNIPVPIRQEEVIQAVKASGGGFQTVDEASILPGRDSLARLGFYVEPTSAIVWPVLENNSEEWTDPIVVLLTGSGYKYG
jgi:threonine synthase